MSFKSLIKGVVGGLCLAVTATAAYAETTMEKIVRTGKITIAVQTQGPPVSFVNKNGERTGLAIELARMMAKDMGVELVIQDYDWKGLIPALKSGKADFIAADMTPTAKRSMQIVFTEPVFFSEIIAFSNKKNGYKSWEELNADGISVGATQASSYADAGRKFLASAKLKEYSGGTAQVAQAVNSGRVNAGISDKANVSGFAAAMPNLVVLDGVLTREPLGFATRPDSMHLLAALDNYMRFIREDGRLNEQLDYWWNSVKWQADHN